MTPPPDAAALASLSCSVANEHPRLEGDALEAFARLLPGWTVREGSRLERNFTFQDYRKAVEFTMHVAGLAEQEDHHPEILLAFGKVTVSTWTHTVKGLSANDFVLAAKIARP